MIELKVIDRRRLIRIFLQAGATRPGEEQVELRSSSIFASGVSSSTGVLPLGGHRGPGAGETKLETDLRQYGIGFIISNVN